LNGIYSKILQRPFLYELQSTNDMKNKEKEEKKKKKVGKR
jgi:hypothetical protein